MMLRQRFWTTLVVLVGVWLSYSPALSQPATNTQALTELSKSLKHKWETGRNARYYSLLRSRQPAQVALNNNLDIELMFIDERGFPVYYEINNIDAARTLSTDDVWPGGSAGYSLTGAAVDYLAVWDAGGVRLTHQEFNGRVTQIDNPSQTHYHSTHVSGTLIAAGVNAAAKGMAFEASLDAYDWDYDDAEAANAAAAGLLVSSHSYGYVTGWLFDSQSGDWYWYGDTDISEVEDYAFGFYHDFAAIWDEIAYDAPYYTVVKSAGNDRNDEGPGPGGGHYVWEDGDWVWSTTTRDPDGGADGYDCISYVGTAKNILAIGAVDDIPDGYHQPSDVMMSSFSGWGPTDDGRIKPDFVANGIELFSTDDDHDSDYRSLSGTSMAAPNAAGSLTLLIKHYQDTHGGATPRAATIKAVIIHTADEAGTSTGPDYQFGWGLMNTTKAADVIADDRPDNPVIIEDYLTNGQTDSFAYQSNGVDPVRVTLAWTDPPGTPPFPSLNPTTPMLVSDLDVRLISHATRTTYYPYLLDPSNPDSPATTGDNTRDNSEQIYLTSPPAGEYTVQVSHKGSLASDQYYSLVVTGLAAVGADELSGPLSGTLGPGVYHVVGPISVESDLSLRIMPATTLLFDTTCAFWIYGTLLAEGTETDSIIFTTDTVANPSRWRSIRFHSGSSDSRLAYCLIENGGGVSSTYSSPILTNCTITLNTAENGGGVHCYGSAPTLTACTISNNSASYGGGIYCVSWASPTFTNCTIIDNTAHIEGGGVCCDGSSLRFTNCTIAGNSAGQDGAGVYSYGAVLMLSSTIIAFSDGDGIYFEESSESDIGYCDIFGNTGGDIVFANDDPSHGPSGIGQLSTTNANDDSCDTYFNILLDPMFVDTMSCDFHLLESSPCIDAGDPVLHPDPDWTITDIGAFYYHQPVDPPSSFTLISPAQDDTCWTLDTLLAWQSAFDPDPDDTVTYEIWLDTLANLSTACEIASDLSDTTFSLADLTDDHSYYWTVHASDLNTVGTWANDTSVFHAYYPEPPGAFALLQPEDGVQLPFGEVDFCWQALRDPDPGDEPAYTLRLVATDTSLACATGSDTCWSLDVGELGINDTAVVEWWVEGRTMYPDTTIESTSRFHFHPPSAVTTEDALLPTEFALHQNYPNPFNATSVIRYDMKQTGLVSVKVYDILGREVATLVHAIVPAGFHKVTWNAANLPSGVYVCRMEAPGFASTRKLLLIK